MSRGPGKWQRAVIREINWGKYSCDGSSWQSVRSIWCYTRMDERKAELRSQGVSEFELYTHPEIRQIFETPVPPSDREAIRRAIRGLGRDGVVETTTGTNGQLLVRWPRPDNNSCGVPDAPVSDEHREALRQALDNLHRKFPGTTFE